MNSEEMRHAYVQAHEPTKDELTEYHKEILKLRIAELEKRAFPAKVVNPASSFQQVKEFHQTFGHPVGDEPQLLDERRFYFRLKLIQEELREFVEAVEEGDLVNAAKELADLKYVVDGAAVEMGLPFDEVSTEVHRSNMSKLGADGKPIYREDGKVLKGPNYEEADVAYILGL